jgi:hypothetical protein
MPDSVKSDLNLDNFAFVVEVRDLWMLYTKLAAPFFVRLRSSYELDRRIVINGSLGHRFQKQNEVCLFTEQNAGAIRIFWRRLSKKRWDIGSLSMLPVPVLHHVFE